MKETAGPKTGVRQPVDWEDVHRRLDVTREAIEEIRAPGPEEKTRILNERARLLAVEEQKSAGKEKLDIVEFLLAAEHYGIESRHVREVLQIHDLTHLPGTPGFLLGIVNIRGEICPVVDLKKIFRLPDRGLPEFNKLIVIRNETMMFGIVADSVAGVRQVLPGSLNPPPQTLTGNRAEYVKGVAPGPVIVLDGEKILRDPGLVVNEPG